MSCTCKVVVCFLKAYSGTLSRRKFAGSNHANINKAQFYASRCTKLEFQSGREDLKRRLYKLTQVFKFIRVIVCAGEITYHVALKIWVGNLHGPFFDKP